MANIIIRNFSSIIQHKPLIKTASVIATRNVCPLTVTNLTAVSTTRKMSSEVERSQKATNNPKKPTIFDKIISKDIPADIIYEDDKILAFNDVNPQAPTHFLVIPKRRIATLDESLDSDKDILGELILTARKLAKERLPNGYRLVINNGKQGCQSVYHLHIHILGGRQLSWPPG